MDVSLKWSFQLPSPVFPLEPGQVMVGSRQALPATPSAKTTAHVSDCVLLQLDTEMHRTCFFFRSQVFAWGKYCKNGGNKIPHSLLPSCQHQR